MDVEIGRGWRKNDPSKPCKTDGCNSVPAAKGYCKFCAQRIRKGKPLNHPKGWNANHHIHTICAHNGPKHPCTKPRQSGYLYCAAHYQRKRAGKEMDIPINNHVMDKGDQYHKCYVCKSHLHKDYFWKDKTRKSGLSSKCKQCTTLLHSKRATSLKQRVTTNP